MRASTSRKRQTGRMKKRKEDNFLHPLCSSKWIIQSHTLILQWEVQTLPCKWHSCSILGNETLKGSVDVQSRLSHKCPWREEWGMEEKTWRLAGVRELDKSGVKGWEKMIQWLIEWLRWRRMAEKASCTETHTHNSLSFTVVFLFQQHTIHTLPQLKWSKLLYVHFCH